MGYYIETKSNHNKAQQIIDLHGAKKTTPTLFDWNGTDALICVVQNGLFDAAAICYDKEEMQAFNEPDDYRPRTWLTLPIDKVIQLCPRVEKMFKD